MARHRFPKTDPRIEILIYESFGFKARANSGKTRLNRRINANQAKKSDLSRLLSRFKAV